MCGYKVLLLALSASALAIGVIAKPNAGESGEVVVDDSVIELEEKSQIGGSISQGGKLGISEGIKIGELGGLGAKKEVVVEEKKETFGLQKMGEWSKLIFNPLELIRSICLHFSLPIDKVLDKIGRTLITGVEVLLYPLLISAKIIEKIFVPDQCRLRFVCNIGRHLEFAKETVVKFSPNFLTGSSHLKALSEGIVGEDCSKSFQECEPKLTKEFEEIKQV